MTENYELELSYKVANTPVNTFPYAHFFLSDVFPAKFYSDLQKNLPDPQAMVSLADTGRVTPGYYKERFILPLNPEGLEKLPEDKKKFWHDFMGWLLGGRFSQVMMRKFAPIIQERFKNWQEVQFYQEALLVNDVTNYSLGPHADAPRKVITMLFYLPADESQKHLGTSIYLPKNPSFTSGTGDHYQPRDFDLVTTMPFLPNSMFSFARTDNSFHGVEPVNDPDTRRWLLLFDIFARLPGKEKQDSASPVGAKV